SIACSKRYTRLVRAPPVRSLGGHPPRGRRLAVATTRRAVYPAAPCRPAARPRSWASGFLDTFWPLVLCIADVDRNLPGGQLVGGVGPQQVLHVLVRGVEPQFLGGAGQDHRHPVVDLGGQLVRRRGEDGEGVLFPEAGEGQQLAVPGAVEVGLFLFGAELLPL